MVYSTRPDLQLTRTAVVFAPGILFLLFLSMKTIKNPTAKLLLCLRVIDTFLLSTNLVQIHLWSSDSQYNFNNRWAKTESEVSSGSAIWLFYLQSNLSYLQGIFPRHCCACFTHSSLYLFLSRFQQAYFSVSTNGSETANIKVMFGVTIWARHYSERSLYIIRFPWGQSSSCSYRNSGAMTQWQSIVRIFVCGPRVASSAEFKLVLLLCIV